ncbi:MAG: TrmH family RNA methyltransferase, partial [archaeon]|nr:TrmH family RNA methyltransferase [archaeon]
MLNPTPNLKILVDTVRDPADMAELTHLALAANIHIYISGNSIRHDHPKVQRKMNSWNPDFPASTINGLIQYSSDFYQLVGQFHEKGYRITGTSPDAPQSLFSVDLSKGNQLVVFGTEMGGLSHAKRQWMDRMVSIPMHDHTRFYTIR